MKNKICILPVLVILVIGCGHDKEKKNNKTMEGHIETVIDWGGGLIPAMNEKGIDMTVHNYFVCDEGKFELTLPEDCTYVGFEKQVVGKGLPITIGEKTIVLHSGAKYRLRGSIVETRSQGAPNLLKTAYLELLEPGTGEAKFKIGISR